MYEFLCEKVFFLLALIAKIRAAAVAVRGGAIMERRIFLNCVVECIQIFHIHLIPIYIVFE